MMDREAAEREAEKRERNKPPRMTHKRWRAAHDSVKGWHVALVDNHAHVERTARHDARRAFETGDLSGFMKAASQALMARCQMAVDATLPHKDNDDVG